MYVVPADLPSSLCFLSSFLPMFTDTVGLHETHISFPSCAPCKVLKNCIPNTNSYISFFPILSVLTVLTVYVSFVFPLPYVHITFYVSFISAPSVLWELSKNHYLLIWKYLFLFGSVGIHTSLWQYTWIVAAESNILTCLGEENQMAVQVRTCWLITVNHNQVFRGLLLLY
jgi:hypothetical protein